MAAQQILVLFVQVRILVGQLREGVQKVFGTLDLFVSLLETEIKYPILQGGILPFWTPSLFIWINPKFLLFHTKISPKKEGFPVHKKWKAPGT